MNMNAYVSAYFLKLF